MARKKNSTTAPVHGTHDLVVRLLCLTTTTGGFRPLELHHIDVEQRSGLATYFENGKQESQKFLSVVRALTTLCAPNGKHNIALMFGLTDSHFHLLFCKHGGPCAEETAMHLRAVWRLVQAIHAAAREVIPADPSLSRATSNEQEIRMQLCDLAYLFAREKALRRAAKHLAAVTFVYDRLRPGEGARTEDEDLMLFLFHLVAAAHTSSLLQFDDNKFTENNDWLRFRSFLRLLRDLTIRRDYSEIQTRLQSRVNESLKGSGLQLDLDKVIKKIIKIEEALVTLYALAVSPRMHDWVRRVVTVHSIPIPDKATIDVDVNAVEDWWYPRSMNRDEVIDKMKRNMDVDTKGVHLDLTIHPQCQLVAWAAKNFRSRFPAARLIPYVTCSRSHCYGCYAWLTVFNGLDHSTLPSIYFDGRTHGKLHPGWAPPSLGSYDQQMLKFLRAKVEWQFRHSALFKAGSASTTMSDSRPYMSMTTELDLRFAEEAVGRSDEGADPQRSALRLPALEGYQLWRAHRKRVIRALSWIPLGSGSLTAIEHLRERLNRGEPLEVEQLEKVGREGDIRRELANIR
ncbi:hypothetical protein B0H19DRAFT_1227446 [Mycena capillaripes]|nr:hypothetical protein B0H19DRAFT_1227446 [Mycena capillaripes]